jgi:hypothetical protein
MTRRDWVRLAIIAAVFAAAFAVAHSPIGAWRLP